MTAAAPRASDRTGPLTTALAHARRLLARDPALARDQALAILEVAPGHPEAQLIKAVADRFSGDLAAADAQLTPLAEAQTRWAEAHYELGLLRAAQGRSVEALDALRRAVLLAPGYSQAWRALGDQLTLAGDPDGADEAYARHISASVNDPTLMRAAAVLCDNRLAAAEQMLREHLRAAPTDVAAIRMLAEVGARLGRYPDAELLLERCLELAPGFTAARHNYAVVLNRQHKAAEVIVEVDRLLAEDPGNPAFRNLKAAALARIGEFEAAIALYEGVLDGLGDQPKIWLSYGHALKTAGRAADSIAAYERSLELAPGFGEAYWSLANLKTYRFSPERVAAMRTQLARDDLAEDDRLHLDYALGKALEDECRFSESFEHYAAGARIRRGQVAYDSADMTGLVARSRAVFTPALFERCAGAGAPAADPIFVVGLPRSGSTLVEQILSSHSAVEGTQELAEVVAIARRLGGKPKPGEVGAYPDVLSDIDPNALAQLGEEFLERTRIQRKTDKPFFIDKMPNNFAHIGLIHLMLPNAKIIDARRHPMAACFSSWKQHFALGQHFSYDLTDLGLYYRDYVDLLDHFDTVLPGRVHRVIYEQMVDDTEGEVRRLLDYCGLPFEPGCLKFYENDRAVRTASSEQVRQPIFRDAIEHWRNYEPWLDPLKAALGPVLQTYPSAPARMDNHHHNGESFEPRREARSRVTAP